MVERNFPQPLSIPLNPDGRTACQVIVHGNAELGVLAGLCRELQQACNGTFFLSVRKVQSLFGIGRMTAWRWLKALRFHGVISLIVKGTKESGKASEWRYLGVSNGVV